MVFYVVIDFNGDPTRHIWCPTFQNKLVILQYIIGKIAIFHCTKLKSFGAGFSVYRSINMIMLKLYSHIFVGDSLFSAEHSLKLVGDQIRLLPNSPEHAHELRNDSFAQIIDLVQNANVCIMVILLSYIQNHLHVYLSVLSQFYVYCARNIISVSFVSPVSDRMYCIFIYNML